MEWFDIFKHTSHGVTAYGWKYIDEADVYSHVTPAAAEQVTVTCPRLPANASALAVYVQMPEINPDTSLSITIRNPSLTLVSRSSGAGSLWGSRTRPPVPTQFAPQARLRGAASDARPLMSVRRAPGGNRLAGRHAAAGIELRITPSI